MILKTLDTMGSLHGSGLARCIEQIGGEQLALNQGTLYPALLKLHKICWITAKWGRSETGRRTELYSVTRLGRTQLQAKTDNWARASSIVARFVEGLS